MNMNLHDVLYKMFLFILYDFSEERKVETKQNVFYI